MPKLKLNWQEPLDFAQKIADNYQGESWALLYSGLADLVKNSTSQIALFPLETILCDDFFEAEKILKSSDKKWFGYFAYEVGGQFESFSKTEKSFVNLPKIWLVNFGLVLNFSHEKQALVASFTDKKYLEIVTRWIPSCHAVDLDAPKILSFDSNFSNDSYLAAISKIKAQIAQGDFYQTNLTRKFFGKFANKFSQKENFQLFHHLTKLSPANYSAFLKLGENYVISSSPELFLKIKNGKILSRPIKGTAPRSSDLKQDKKNKSYLKNSAKERAENLMIVDLVRNDLARVCVAGSVVVKKLFSISAYKNIFHLSSEIHGKLAENFDAIDALKACFPAGSMTGAPKIKAIEAAAKLEKLDRGVYSGAVGVFSKDEVNSSVVIRTLVLSGDKFEFQVGGGITFESDEKAELAEIFSKAKGILELLGANYSQHSISFSSQKNISLDN
ncbi:MAG: anthranilate synthase component I family protein [Rickettsiales bacterium]|nr:anthranilate synthase component I family protein [Rickettsiales bacterium]